jgi:integrase
MASISNQPGNRKMIQFLDGEKRRRTVRLGKATKRDASTFKLRIEALVSAQIMGHLPDDETGRWLAGLDDAMYQKLAAVELVAERASTRLGVWLPQHIASLTLKPESIRKLNQTKGKLVVYFGTKVNIRKITSAMAADWRLWLGDQISPQTKKPISLATINTHCGNAKTLFAEACRRELIPRNPFLNLSSGRIAAKTDYIDIEMIEKVIAACPDAEWRLLFGLTRYAGLRCPSETHLLTWSHVDWESKRLFVQSPKTEGHKGKESRVVPIGPRLMQLLQQRFDEAEEGEERLIAVKGKGALQRQVRAICQRAGVQMWGRLWQSLRSSCEKWWAMDYPQYAVSYWIGHSIEISGKHYVNSVPDELYDKANSALHNALQPVAEMGRNVPQPQSAKTHESADSRRLQHIPEIGSGLHNGAGGSRTPVS